MNKYIILAVAWLCLSPSMFAQKSWTLQECIDYAIDHNIDLHKHTELIRQKEIQLHTAQQARLPHISAEVNDDFAFHNNMVSGISSSQTGMPSSANLMSLSGSINASLPLLDGGRISSQRKTAQFTLESALAHLDQAKKDVGIQIAVQYLNVLYHQGMAEVSRKQVELSQELLRKAEAQVREGNKPDSELAQAQAQLAADEYQLAVESGDERMATIRLAQLLTLEDVSSFSVKDPSLTDNASMPTMDQTAQAVFDLTVANYPSIRAAQAEIKAAEANVLAEKSLKLPSLDLVGSVGTQSDLFFTKTYKDMMPGFGKQLGDYHQEVIGLRLRIPIFTGYQTRNAIRLAESQVRLQQLDLTDQRLQLRTEIEEAYYNAKVAQSRHGAAVKAEASAHTNYDYQLKSYEAGRSTIFDLNLVNQQWLKAQQDVLQSRYDYLIRLKIIDYYLQ